MTNKIPVSYFKSHCLQILNNLQKTNQTITITKRNKQLAQIIPIKKNVNSIFNILKTSAAIKGDIVQSLEEEWDADK